MSRWGAGAYLHVIWRTSRVQQRAHPRSRVKGAKKIAWPSCCVASVERKERIFPVKVAGRFVLGAAPVRVEYIK